MTPKLAYTPSEAAERLGITTKALADLVKAGGYEFIAIAEDGKPGDHGRNRWGLTPAQLDTIIRGQTRRFTKPPVDPEPAGELEKARRPDAWQTAAAAARRDGRPEPEYCPESPDGISRLRRPKRKR